MGGYWLWTAGDAGGVVSGVGMAAGGAVFLLIGIRVTMTKRIRWGPPPVASAAFIAVIAALYLSFAWGGLLLGIPVSLALTAIGLILRRRRLHRQGD